VTGAPDALVAGDTVPQVAPPQPVPESAHVTPLFAESFATVAITVCVAPACTVAVVVGIVTVITAGVGGGVVPPPPVLLETLPVQPTACHSAMSVAMPIRQRANLGQDRFTVNSPKLTLFFRALMPGWGARPLAQIHST